jgi:NAD+ synthase (glutamine-hydrolysing)
MVMSYMMAQLLPWVRGHSPGFLLVLGSGNVDEALRGYMTKYDCSSADLNPIGSINKGDLKLLLKWAADKYGYSALRDVVKATPTAELRPLEPGETDGEHTQV